MSMFRYDHMPEAGGGKFHSRRVTWGGSMAEDKLLAYRTR